MTTRISIIIPVYNVESYISDCIKSVIAQTYTDWELILVDDGSTDYSWSICCMYADMDSRIRVVHQTNQGVSAARNKGIDVAKGEYITFIDSDDYVTPTYLSDMVAFDSDIVATGMYLWYAIDDSSKLETFDSQAGFSTKDNNMVDAIIIGELKGKWKSPCCKLFRRSIIIDHQIKFTPQLSYGEDHLFVMSFLNCANSATILPMANYIYTHYGRVSLTNRRVNYSEMFNYILKLERLRIAMTESFGIKSLEYDKFCQQETISTFWQTIYSLYLQQKDKAERKRVIANVTESLHTNVLSTDVKLAPTYKLMQQIYRFCPFGISDLLYRLITK